MKTPDEFMVERAEASELAKEGGQIPAGPSRRKWWVYVAVAVVFGALCLWGKSCVTGKGASASLPTVRPSVGPGSDTSSALRPDGELPRVLWRAGELIGATYENEEWQARLGECIGPWRVTSIGLRSVDLVSGRRTARVPCALASRSTGTGSSASAGSLAGRQDVGGPGGLAGVGRERIRASRGAPGVQLGGGGVGH